MNDVFALLIIAEAGEGNEYPEGQQRNLLILVPARSHDEAAEEALLALSDKRWRFGEIQQADRFVVSPHTVDDPIVREAAQKAFAGERSIIVY